MSPLPARLRILFIALVATAVAGLAIPVAASAAETYTYRAEPCDTNRGSGSVDANGVMYAACGTKILRFNAAGTRLATITVGTNVWGSVAPSPTGAYLYVSLKTANGGWALRRLHKDANGVWMIGAWRADQFQLNNVNHNPVPRNLKTDEFGYLYVSNAGTVPETGKIAPTRILRYAPNGDVMTHFGEHNDEPLNPYAFFQNRGLAVTRDGRSLYVTSHLQGQIRRFDIQANGAYAYAQTIGKLDTNCATNGGLSAVSDVGVDPWGYVYAADTTCRKIKKFTKGGAFVATIATGPRVLHEIGVSRRGDVFAAEWDRFYSRAATNPVPGPIPAITRPVIDVTAPNLAAVALPAVVTSRDVQLDVTATDDVGIAEARVADEDGEWGPWGAYSDPLPHQLTDGYTYKVVYLQVRDAAGNESGVVTTSTRYDRPGDVVVVGRDTVAPTLAAITLPALTPTRAITIDIDAADDVQVAQARFANEDGTWGGWSAFASPAAHTLSAGYSIKGVYVQVRDAAGNESNVRFATTRYQADAPPVGDEPAAADTVAPTLVGITIPAITTQQAIAIAIDARDDVRVAQMRIANEDGTWGPWQAFASPTTHTLSAGYSTKGVYVQVRDAAGNESGIVFRTLSYRAG